MTTRKIAVIVGVLIAMAPRALAEPAPESTPIVEVTPEIHEMPTPHLWMRSGPGVLHTVDEKRFLIPIDSHILTVDRWMEQETEKKRLQEQEIRLKAENESLTRSANEVPWRIIAMGVAVGLVTGAYIGLKF